MIESNWRDELRFLRIVMFAVIVAVVTTIALKYWPAVVPECGSAQSEFYRTQKTDPTSLSTDETSRAILERANVCAQHRMARAAEIGLWLLLFTLAATAIAAYYTGKTLRVMRASSEKQLRAYVNLKSAVLTLGDEYAVGRHAVVDVTFENFGVTPASNVRCEAFVRLALAPYAADAYQRPIELNVGPMGPSAELRLLESVSLDKLLFMQVSALNVRLLVHGELSYETFGARHVTSFGLMNGPPIYKDLAGRSRDVVGYVLVADPHLRNQSS
jgi:hypothetical protein